MKAKVGQFSSLVAVQNHRCATLLSPPSLTKTIGRFFRDWRADGARARGGEAPRRRMARVVASVSRVVCRPRVSSAPSRPRVVVVARACVDQPREDDDAPRHRPKPLATAATPLALDASLTRSILLVGDGDLSFSLALARRAPNARITATTFEPRETIVSDWGGDESIRELRALPNVEDVLHSVDATRLHTRASPLHEIGANERTGNANDDRKRWDRVLFMFPHIAGKGKISKNRDLLCGFFQSVGAVLAPFGVVEVGLVAGQGGTPADGVHRRDFGNTWMVSEQAAKGDFVLCATEPFDYEAWRECEYTPTGHWRGLTSGARSFVARDGVVHAFARPGEMPATHARCPHPVTHRRAFSIWIDEESRGGFREPELERTVKRAVSPGVHVASLTRMEPNDWTCPSTGRTSRTYVVELTSTTLAWDGRRATEEQFRVREALATGRVPGAELR